MREEYTLFPVQQSAELIWNSFAQVHEVDVGGVGPTREKEINIIWTWTWWSWVGITNSKWFSAFSFVDVSSAAMIIVNSLSIRSLTDTGEWEKRSIRSYINQQYDWYVPWTWVRGEWKWHVHRRPGTKSRYFRLSNLANQRLDILHTNKTYESSILSWCHSPVVVVVVGFFFFFFFFWKKAEKKRYTLERFSSLTETITQQHITIKQNNWYWFPFSTQDSNKKEKHVWYRNYAQMMLR